MSSNTMKAALLAAPNAPFVLTDVPRPRAGAGEVLVRIHASAVNPLDTKIRRGAAAHAQHPLPAITGIDTAGEVAEVGEGVTAFKPGDKVYGMTGGVGGVQGSLAEFAAVDARLLAPAPSTLSLREAATLPLAFITAWEGLVDRARVQSGQTVLVLGGTGAVGQAAIQLAKALGARVFATAGAARRALVERFGIPGIDGPTTDMKDIVRQYTDGRGFDVVYDTAGGESLDRAFHAVARFGHVVSALGWGAHALAPLSFRAASYSGVFTLLPLLTREGRAAHGEILREIGKLAEQGRIDVTLDPRRFTLANVDEAHALVESRQAEGKVVVDIAV
ncbi:NADPH:quinone reductase-like Zn-dependent oxidoreductase [Paraburkholderia bannensis]|uniref:NADPH:quinone reductase-like Zn-dependent oxidoreductase n=1 Tax=Paraburkholderia bannensis TaxID=765414 RepID=A0A7W9TWA6_9BURK|nr:MULTISPECIES: zinc-dependent alcohol dehydrogenase family protein [Paraburkholderia]MBB3256932.1 NADPH:quinone reductase-like Zn-dependent oxidoreductase [Paraburkholderia sp. WP4_3_2]MBB6101886.1 NADPH:quinone reductase-like Zn-dependent oxidoreductase [Paraburkholderia bannensis]